MLLSCVVLCGDRCNALAVLSRDVKRRRMDY